MKTKVPALGELTTGEGRETGPKGHEKSSCEHSGATGVVAGKRWGRGAALSCGMKGQHGLCCGGEVWGKRAEEKRGLSTPASPVGGQRTGEQRRVRPVRKPSRNFSETACGSDGAGGDAEDTQWLVQGIV